MVYNPIQTTPVNISSTLSKSGLGKVEVINNVFINSDTLDSSASSFELYIDGTINALFDLQVQRSSDSRYYNFDTRTFEATYSNKSRRKKLSPGVYNIEVPAASGGDTYTAQIYTSPAYNTEITINSSKYYFAVAKKQFKDTTITFIASTNTTLLSSTTLGTLTGSTIKPSISTIKIQDKQMSRTPAIEDFGFSIINTNSVEDLNNGKWDEGAVYWQSGNYVANGGGTDSTSLTLTSVDGLFVGMQIAIINNVYQSVLRAITAINTETKTVTLDGNETWSDTHVIIFRAYGPKLINDAIGVKLSVDTSTVKISEITTTVRTAVTGGQNNINVNGVTGIGAGAQIRFRGLDKSSSSNPCVISLVDNTNGLTEGNLTFTNGETSGSSDRPIRVKTKVYIDNCSNELFLTGNINVTKFPSSNQNIYVDIDKIVTARTSGA